MELKDFERPNSIENSDPEARRTSVPALFARLGGTIAKAPMQKLIAFDDETSALLRQLGHDRMATLQELADEAFADLLKKLGIPIPKRLLDVTEAPGTPVTA